MHEKTFAALYCEQRAIGLENYADAVFRETLYPHARLGLMILRLFSCDHFEADYAFVNNVGALRRLRDYSIEATEFGHHLKNRGFLRSTLNLRVSSRRLRRLVRQTLHSELEGTLGMAAEDHSAASFAGAAEGGMRKRAVAEPVS